MFGLDPDIQVYKTSIFKLEALNKPEDDSVYWKLPWSEDRANMAVVAVGVPTAATIGHIHEVVGAVADDVGRRPIVIIYQLRPTICRKQRVDSWFIVIQG